MSTGSGLWTIRAGDWKLITGLGSGGFSKPRNVKALPEGPEGQLYNLSSDPSESKNLYLQMPGKVKELTEELERLRSSEMTRG